METITFHTHYPRKIAVPMIHSTFQREIDLVSVQLERLKDQAKEFEQKYGMNSEEFYEKFEKGELGDQQDFFLWVSNLDIYKKLDREHTLLKEFAEQCC